jgi:peptidoglycan/xylan/chitin deacetylase (PgdA/CDA1 family)
MGIGQIRGEFDRAFAAFESILGRRPNAVAAPAWQVTHASLTVQEQLKLRYASDLRNGPPCTLVVGQDHFHTLQFSTDPVWRTATVGMP